MFDIIKIRGFLWKITRVLLLVPIQFFRHLIRPRFVVPLSSGRVSLRFSSFCLVLFTVFSFVKTNNTYAFDFPPTKWNIADRTQTPGLYLNGVCYNDVGTSHQNAVYFFWVYKNSNCSGNFTIYPDQIIVVTISGYTGFIDLADGAQYLYGSDGISLIGVEPRDTGAGTVYDLYFLGTYRVDSPLKIGIRTTRSGFFAVNSVVSYDYVSNDYNTDLSTIIGHLQTISSSITDVYVRLGGVASNVSNIATNVSDIEDILDNLDTSIQDIADNSDEELQTNKTEKSNIENQTPEDSGFNIENQQTTNMIGVVNTFIAGLQNVSTTGSCVLSGDLGYWDGVNVNMGNLDLCSHQPPTYVLIGCNLVMIVLVFGLTWWMIHLAIKLWRYTS